MSDRSITKEKKEEDDEQEAKLLVEQSPTDGGSVGCNVNICALHHSSGRLCCRETHANRWICSNEQSHKSAA